MLVYCGPSVYVDMCVDASDHKQNCLRSHLRSKYVWANITNWLRATNTKIICFLTALSYKRTLTFVFTQALASLSVRFILCETQTHTNRHISVVSRASYILCMQVKKKRKNKSKSKDKHVYQLTEKQRATHTHSVRQREAESDESVLSDICVGFENMLPTCWATHALKNLTQILNSCF